MFIAGIMFARLADEAMFCGRYISDAEMLSVLIERFDDFEKKNTDDFQFLKMFQDFQSELDKRKLAGTV